MNAWESMNFHTLSAHISTLKGTTGRGMREETERDRENERKEERNVTRRAMLRMCSCSQLNAALTLGHIKLLTAHN